MNKRKIQAVINRIKDDIKVNNENIITIKNEWFGNEKKPEILFMEGQIYEATHIIKLLEMLKESIK
jgi:hypothetical protein